LSTNYQSTTLPLPLLLLLLSANQGDDDDDYDAYMMLVYRSRPGLLTASIITGCSGASRYVWIGRPSPTD